LLAPARAEDLSLSQAQVQQAKAAVDLVSNQIQENKIIAPFDGQIAKMEFEIGEQVNANQPALSLLTEGNLEVEVDISESDINKINVNDKVEITFDSLGEDKKFVGQVGFIEPAETVIQDVIYYKVEIYLADIASEYQTLIKPGMTTNIVITTAEKENVLIAPNRAIIDKNGSGKFLRLLVNEKLMEIPVSVGLKGDNGLVEIISDQVKAGDLAITFIKETTKE